MGNEKAILFNDYAAIIGIPANKIKYDITRSETLGTEPDKYLFKADKRNKGKNAPCVCNLYLSKSGMDMLNAHYNVNKELEPSLCSVMQSLDDLRIIKTRRNFYRTNKKKVINETEKAAILKAYKIRPDNQMITVQNKTENLSLRVFQYFLQKSHSNGLIKAVNKEQAFRKVFLYYIKHEELSFDPINEEIKIIDLMDYDGFDNDLNIVPIFSFRK